MNTPAHADKVIATPLRLFPIRRLSFIRLAALDRNAVKPVPADRVNLAAHGYARMHDRNAHPVRYTPFEKPCHTANDYQ